MAADVSPTALENPIRGGVKAGLDLIAFHIGLRQLLEAFTASFSLVSTPLPYSGGHDGHSGTVTTLTSFAPSSQSFRARGRLGVPQITRSASAAVSASFCRICDTL